MADITGLILAGGEGRRVGGRNKGLLVCHGKPLVQHVLEILLPQVSRVMISANRDLETYRSYGAPVYRDETPWLGQGPLAGLASCAAHVAADTGTLMVVPCDTPLLPENLVSRLYEALQSDAQYEIAYAATPARNHYSVFLCRPEINAALAQHIAAGRLSLNSWIARHRNIRVLFDDEQAFSNMNDLQTLTENQ